MIYLDVTYDTNNFYVNWGAYHTLGLTQSIESAFDRAFISIISNNVSEIGNKYVKITLKDNTQFRLSLTQYDNTVYIISKFNGLNVTDLDVFYNELKVLIK